jgi:ATPase subunit of ABC transporter with duplicated ATPase domains
MHKLLTVVVSHSQDIPATLWLEHHLSSTNSTLVLVSHDAVFTNTVATETILLRQGQLAYFEGPPRAQEADERRRRHTARTQLDALERKKDHVRKAMITISCFVLTFWQIENSIREGRMTAKQTGDQNR